MVIAGITPIALQYCGRYDGLIIASKQNKNSKILLRSRLTCKCAFHCSTGFDPSVSLFSALALWEATHLSIDI
jgi:hypothetical protein